MKKLLLILLSAMLLFSCSPKETHKSSNEGKTAVQTEKGEAGLTRYSNLVCGFSVEAPNSFSANENLAPIELRLERDDCVIEVIKEEISSQEGFENYSWYSNLFLKNDKDHRLEESADITVQGYSSKLTRWSRDSLGSDDRCHYCVTDIFTGSETYTVIIKASVPLEELDFDFRSVAESLRKEDAVQELTVSFPSGGGAPMNDEAKEAFRKFFLDDGPMHWGIYYHKQPVEGMEKFEALEEKVGKLDVALLYTEILDEYNPSLVYGGLVNAWESGKICELTLQTSIDAENDEVYKILKGERDEFLFKYACDVVRFGHPVILRPFNEMNGEWCNYSSYHLSRDPDLYIRLYKYIYNIFSQYGAENVIWVWNPNETSYPTFKWNSAELYYPGGSFVDAVGLCGYNAGTGIPGEKWRSFSEIYDGYYQHMDSTYNKPMMITEFGSSSIGGDKLQWVKDMFADIKKYPKLHTAVWLHDKNTDPETGRVTRSFYLDDTPGVTDVFKSELEK